MRNLLNVLAIEQLEGGTYTVDTVLNITNAIPDNDIPIANAQSVICLIIFKTVSTV